MSFKLLKKQSEDKNRLEKLVTALDKPARTYDTDESYWSLTRDKQDNGTAIIRFLSASPGDEDLTLPVVEIYSHRFKGKTGRWYIENCRSTIGEEDPVNEYNTKLWNTNDEQLQGFVREFSKRKLNYVANILVVVDPANPENEGKVFKYSFGKRIYEKILAAMKGNPALKKKGFDVFDYWKGADFALVAKKVDNQINYNDSTFETPSVIHYNDEVPLTDTQIEEDIYNKQYSLKAEISPDKFKPYDVLQKKLYSVLGIDSSPEVKQETAVEKKLSAAPKQKASPKKEEQEEEDEVDSHPSTSSDDVDKIFKDLDIEF